jgi:hypothetical protein
MTSAITAAARFISDSMASERRPTDPVIKYADDFKIMVATDAAIDIHTKFIGAVFSAVLIFPSLCKGLPSGPSFTIDLFLRPVVLLEHV